MTDSGSAPLPCHGRGRVSLTHAKSGTAQEVESPPSAFHVQAAKAAGPVPAGGAVDASGARHAFLDFVPKHLGQCQPDFRWS